jgi:serine/threonine protein kinase
MKTPYDAEVYLATNPGNGQRVIVKRHKPKFCDNSELLRRTETHVLLNHPCIVRILRFSLATHSTSPEIHTEYAECGSLQNVLAHVRRGAIPFFWHATGKSIIICGIVLGMLFVHRRGLMHNRLGPQHIMINALGRALIGGFDFFGLPSPREMTYLLREVLPRNELFTSAVDVAIFAVIVYQIIVSTPVNLPRTSHPHYLWPRSIVELPPIPDAYGKLMQRLCESCISQNPESRPSFADILDEFWRHDFALMPGANAALIRDYVCGVLLWEEQYAQSLQQIHPHGL